MASIWTLAKVGQLEFAAASTLLAIEAKGNSITPTEHSDDESDGECAPEDDEEDHGTAKLSPRLATYGHDVLKIKFLDRLAEVFSREKSLPQSLDRQDSEHVAATAWIEPNAKCPLTVIVAKNRGFLDDRDVKMLADLKLWLRVLSITRRYPPAEIDKIWINKRGLIEYSRARLWYHVSHIQMTDKGSVTAHGDVAV